MNILIELKNYILFITNITNYSINSMRDEMWKIHNNNNTGYYEVFYEAKGKEDVKKIVAQKTNVLFFSMQILSIYII